MEGKEEEEGGEGDFVASSNFSSLPLLTASEVLPPPPFSPPLPLGGKYEEDSPHICVFSRYFLGYKLFSLLPETLHTTFVFPREVVSR